MKLRLEKIIEKNRKRRFKDVFVAAAMLLGTVASYSAVVAAF